MNSLPPTSSPQDETEPALQPSLFSQLLPAAATDESQDAGEDAWSLSQIVGMVRRKAWVIGVLAIALSAYMGFRASKQVVEYQSNFRLLVEPVNEKHELGQLTDSKNAPATQVLDYSTQIEVLLSPKLLKPLIETLEQDYPGITVDSVLSHLSVIRLGETKIIEVSYYDTNSDQVKALLDKLSQGYLDYSLQDQQAQLKQGLNFVEKQLPSIRTKVNSLQQQIQELRQTYNFNDPDSYTEQLSAQLTAIAQQRQTMQADLAALQIRYRNLEGQQGAMSTLNTSSNYQATLQQYEALAQQIAIESARFGPRNPTIQLLKRQQANLEPILQEQATQALDDQLASVINEMQIISARDRSIAGIERTLNQRFQQMPIVSRQYTELQQELRVATDSLTRFLETQERLQVQAAQNEVPWQLISEPANPYRKASGSLYKALMTGAMGGLILGIVVAFLLEKLENTYYTTVELTKKVKLSLMGIIPFNPDLEEAELKVHVVDLRDQLGENSHAIKDDFKTLKSRVKTLLNQAESSTPDDTSAPGSPNGSAPTSPASPRMGNYWLDGYDAYGFLEAFRALHANLGRLSDVPLRSLVISSALPAEGRTTIAVHLVQAAAAMGRRVLLVDAHLRRGGTQVHTLLGLSNTLGLSDFLNGETGLNQIIQRMSWESSLFVISAGTTPPDPTRLLSSPTMVDLMRRLRKTFDLVIYDMPPLMGLADVNLIASQADGILLVAGLGKRGSAEALTQTIERLQIARLPIVGMVANKARDYSVDLYAQGI